MEEKTIYDLIEIRFGKERVLARPFEFDQDKDGNLLCASKAITTCPNCGHGQEVYLGTDDIVIECDNCGFGKDAYKVDPQLYAEDVSVDRSLIEDEILNILNEEKKPEGIKTNTKSITVDEESGSLKSSCPFRDPIEMGLFITDEL